MPKLKDPLAPQPKSVQRSVRLTEDRWEEVDRIAQAKGATSASVAARLLEWAIDRYGSTFMREGNAESADG